MLARLPSLYQLVLYIYLCLMSCSSNFYLHDNLYQSELGFFFSVVCVCLCLSLFKYPKLSFYYCLQSTSLSLSNSVPVSSPIFFMNAQMSNLLSTPSFIMTRQSKRCRQRLIFWVFVAGDIHRQTMVLLYKIEEEAQLTPDRVRHRDTG